MKWVACGTVRNGQSPGRPVRDEQSDTSTTVVGAVAAACTQTKGPIVVEMGNVTPQEYSSFPTGALVRVTNTYYEPVQDIPPRILVKTVDCITAVHAGIGMLWHGEPARLHMPVCD